MKLIDVMKENRAEHEAADQLDEIVTRILSKLRKGKSVTLPGLGTFLPGLPIRFRFEGAKTATNAARAREARREHR
jgi:nucleoid DNA-binding protein